MTWTVPILAACRFCGGRIDRVHNVRLRAYCSKRCRDKENRHKVIASGYNQRVQQKKLDALAVPASNKKRCLICGRWYRRVGRHIQQRHGVTAREYRAANDLPLGRGIMTEEGRERMRESAIANHQPERLIEVGQPTRFRRDDPRAKTKINKGRHFPHSDAF